MKKFIGAMSLWALSLSLMIGIQSASHAQVLTAQYDNFRTGADLHETVLKPSNVNTRDFGKLFSRTVDGDVFAQPLYVPSLAMPGVGFGIRKSLPCRFLGKERRGAARNQDS